MTWCKLDDQLHGHPKIKSAWHRSQPSLGLHLMALSYCACYLTDGFVPEEFVVEKLPGLAARKAVLALTETSLWEADPSGGWWICDYLEYNESRVKVLARRQADARRKQRDS